MNDFSPAIRQKGKSTLIDILVTTNAKKTGINGFDPWRKRINVDVKAPPLQNRANSEIVDFFSRLLGADVRLASGARSQRKTLEVTLPLDEVKEALHEGE